MITVRFSGTPDRITGIETIGHASGMTGIFQRLFPVGKSQVYGNILCASVSVLMAHLQIELEAVVMVKLLIERDKKRGFFSLKLEDDRDAVKARQSFLAMMVSLRNLAKKYPDELKVDDL